MERKGRQSHNVHHQAAKKSAGRSRAGGKIKALRAAEGISLKEALLRMKEYLSDCRSVENPYV